jgi:hypothetical protein
MPDGWLEVSSRKVLRLAISTQVFLGLLLDVAIPGDRNVIQKETEKILKYKDLTIEIQRMWNVKLG